MLKKAAAGKKKKVTRVHPHRLKLLSQGGEQVMLVSRAMRARSGCALSLPNCELRSLMPPWGTKTQRATLLPQQSDPGGLLRPSGDCLQLLALRKACPDSLLGAELFRHFSL